MTKKGEINVDRTVDVIGDICPIPLLETRKAMVASKSGEIIEVIGTHDISKKEIPIAIKASGSRILKTSEEEGIWHIFIEKA